MVDHISSHHGKKGGTGGCASTKFAPIFRKYDLEYRPDIVNLLESRVNGSKANAIIAKMGFQYSHWVETVGFSGRLWVGWKESVRIEVVRNHLQFILVRFATVFNPKNIFIAFVYASLKRMKRKMLWYGLE
ncbi:hypothetical protein J1N35_033318 [Gossypium stocksii]|uniref:Uncharacterized protein n=1 Tax=Gossypium stocksii TaxID=47602 RepID=A0A9D3ZP67_9ROSI|nr:hypothetical protein J1N35_033318 [Gossypium stocksii]